MNIRHMTTEEMIRAVDNDPKATENERALAEALDKTLQERDAHFKGMQACGPTGSDNYDNG